MADLSQLGSHKKYSSIDRLAEQPFVTFHFHHFTLSPFRPEKVSSPIRGRAGRASPTRPPTPGWFLLQMRKLFISYGGCNAIRDTCVYETTPASNLFGCRSVDRIPHCDHMYRV